MATAMAMVMMVVTVVKASDGKVGGRAAGNVKTEERL